MVYNWLSNWTSVCGLGHFVVNSNAVASGARKACTWSSWSQYMLREWPFDADGGVVASLAISFRKCCWKRRYYQHGALQKHTGQKLRTWAKRPMFSTFRCLWCAVGVMRTTHKRLMPLSGTLAETFVKLCILRNKECRMWLMVFSKSKVRVKR